MIKVIILEIQTKRLTLHPFSLEDAFLLYNYRRLENVEKYQSFHHFTLDQAKETVLMKGPVQKPGSYQLGIYLNQWLIGDIFFYFTNDLDCFLGYTLDPNYWHQGYAYEAVKASIDYLYQHLSIQRYYAYIDPENIASIKLIRKLGFLKLENGIYFLSLV